MSIAMKVRKLLAYELVRNQTRKHDQEMDDNCLGWIVMSHDEEVDSLYFIGVFPTREAAINKLMRHNYELNAGLGDSEKGWKLSVHRLMSDG